MIYVMTSTNSGAFCLYLWRAANVPGVLYIADDIHLAQSLYIALAEEGYLVRAVNLEGDVEYTMSGSAFVPVAVRSQQYLA